MSESVGVVSMEPIGEIDVVAEALSDVTSGAHCALRSVMRAQGSVIATQSIVSERVGV